MVPGDTRGICPILESLALPRTRYLRHGAIHDVETRPRIRRRIHGGRPLRASAGRDWDSVGAAPGTSTSRGGIPDSPMDRAPICDMGCQRSDTSVLSPQGRRQGAAARPFGPWDCGVGAVSDERAWQRTRSASIIPECCVRDNNGAARQRPTLIARRPAHPPA